MFDSALELISEAASNSFFVFCCCNLIIVMILMGSKPSYSFEQGRHNCIPVETNTYANGIQVLGRNNYRMHSVDEFRKLSNVKEEEEDVADDDDKEESSNVANDKKEDDEFRKRAEEFIHKVNSGWRAELLKTSDFTLIESLQTAQKIV